jgi:hypothetical protein
MFVIEDLLLLPCAQLHVQVDRSGHIVYVA